MVKQALMRLADGIPSQLPDYPAIDAAIDQAPARKQILSTRDKELAIRNALRYIPEKWHVTLAAEFKHELETFGRIFMMRFRPTEYEMKAYPIDNYPAKCRQAASIMLMIQNNLDPAVAQFPHQLITYGGNGAVFQNWIQYHLVMQYLSQMTESQSLVMYSGHPLGLFPSHPDSPRVVITNGMVIPNYSSQDDYERLNALGVSQYGQMTAGSYMYIGPQGIVHGTTITLLNAARMKLGIASDASLAGICYVTSGLGGMSGAQAKAAVIAGCVGIISEVNPIAAKKRHQQGWLSELYEDIDQVIDRMLEAKANGEAVSIGHVGNIVDLWERLVERDIQVELGSDQTSLHNPWQGGYFPTGIDFEEAKLMMSQDPSRFKKEIQSTLLRHAKAVNTMVERGTYFWDYGNAFLLEASRAGADICDANGDFIHPSYVEDIMGPRCFDLGFGPFRWVCCSGSKEDLEMTDNIAMQVLEEMSATAPVEIQQQLKDNIQWISAAGRNRMVVGSQARILYADEEGRKRIASAFNEAIKEGEISAGIVLGRDHHDVSGTDSPYRETANIKDGSNLCADMAIHNVIGDSFRGATWVSIHNGGGVGWGEVINGGFGMYLDGSQDSERRLNSMLSWDVNNGIARRAWARNPEGIFAIKRAMEKEPLLKVTLPNLVDDEIIANLF
ncbi:MAG TPA: urocanate hydratase [Candidatus Poseidoniales archaeon]|nr:urocanate hydratase [Candidatus Poseidoniales archaeon]